MPRNRQDIARQQKIDEIVRVAEAVLRSGGYDALSLSGIAQELGLARGAIYWYFPSKDDLLVAAAALAFGEALSNPPTRAGYAKRIEWAMDQLATLGTVSAAVRDRAHHSNAVASFEDAFQRELCDRLRDALRPQVAEERLDDVANSVVVFVQGLLSMPLSKAARHDRLAFVLGELV